METEFCYISPHRYLNTVFLLLFLFVIFPVLGATSEISRYTINLLIFPVTLISIIIFCVLEKHLSTLKGSFEADEETCTLTLSKKELHFRYEEITGIMLDTFPKNGRGGSLIGYKIELIILTNHHKYVIQQEMSLDGELKQHPEQISQKLKQTELTKIGNFLKRKTGLL